MKELIQKAFPICAINNCLETLNLDKFKIANSNYTKCFIVDKEDERGIFTVLNPNYKDINFLAIDKCIFKSSEHKKCDFAVFDNILFCFVEIKDTKKRRGHKKDAKLQLRVTIEKFKKLLNFDNYKIEAIICFKNKRSIPAGKTRMQSAEIEFRDDLNVDLLEGNQKEFI